MECKIVKDKKNREAALIDFLQMIQSSWTWARLTEKEQKTMRDQLIEWWGRGKIQGNYDARWNVMQIAYSFFLDGTGYAPCGWREPDDADERPVF